MRIVVVLVLAVVAVACLIGNWQLFLRIRRGERASLVPFLGGTAGLVLCLVVPEISWRWGVLWFLADPGTYVLGVLEIVVRRLLGFRSR
jgi:hypothetical protein